MAFLRTTFLLLATLCALTSAKEDPFKADNDLITSLAEHGSHGGWTVSKACDTCARGLFATKAYKEGDSIGHIDMDQCLYIDTRDQYMALMVYRIFYEKETNETFGAYLKTLPGPNEVNCYITMSEEQVALLQDPDYTTAITEHQQYAETVLNDLLENGHEHGLDWEPTLEQVKYYMGLAVTRSIELHADAEDPEAEMHSYMCPVIDLPNHSQSGNAERVQYSNGTVGLVATAEIAEGEEITTAYNTGIMARPDMQLLIHGFVVNESEEHPPLSSIDLPDYDPEYPFHPTEGSDDLSGLTHTEAAEELERVSAILESLPTTEEEDLSILESGQFKGYYYSEQIVKWRVLRKRALKQRIEALQELLGEL